MHHPRSQVLRGADNEVVPAGSFGVSLLLCDIEDHLRQLLDVRELLEVEQLSVLTRADPLADRLVTVPASRAKQEVHVRALTVILASKLASKEGDDLAEPLGEVIHRARASQATTRDDEQWTRSALARERTDEA